MWPDVLCGQETFVCALYGMPNLHKVDDARYAASQQKYSPTKHSDPLDKIKGITPSSVPPCHVVLRNKIRRNNYVATLWKKARVHQPCALKAEDHGWKLNESAYRCNELGGNMARSTQFPIKITRSTIIYEIVSPGAAGSSIYI